MNDGYDLALQQKNWINLPIYFCTGKISYYPHEVGVIVIILPQNR